MMSGFYILAADSWRDADGVRHRKGDAVSPPESEVPRLLRAKAIITPEAVAAAEAAEAAALEAEEEAAAAAAAAQAEALADAGADAQAEPTEPAAQAEPVEPVEPTQADAVAVVEPAVTEPVQSTGQVKKPLKTAPVKKWEDYAVTQGMGRAEAEAHTKDQLIGKFG
ncbi:hypothetical protein SEA_BLINO_7 [Gordonia phage Blino]|uniref:Uncharacterized protein n=1 Tax=Gordonia phage Blino TaxID=2793696 RepID=A0A7T0Q399_9CAUD|nr:head-tail connector protein [Gordonia phage CarolAnn]YP_010114096.1 head-tail connector protein [Gordonia phage Blino]AOE44099.1 hypothetical protein SEA_CAROLANN_7 [Gordonia phage CarolAnn]QPL13955.1 hypothetical protein SEA_BLINO_7 [Gordonia phage Blino]